MTNKNFQCSAPWEGMFINPDGDFRVCCAGQSLGNLNKNSLEDILYGAELNKVRTDMLENGSSNYCTNCIESEEKSGKSLRDQFKKDLTNVDTTKLVPKNIDIRWRNTCQLRCGYCNSEWSSTYARWEGKTERVSAVEWQRAVLDYIANDKTSIEVANFLGGEPLLLKENIELLDYIDPNIHISLVTNLSLTKVESSPVYQKLVNRATSWLVSLEATGNKFEFIRRNANWEITKSNYETLKINPGSSKGCHMTYCILSAFSLVDVFDWLYEVDPDPNNNFTFPSVLLGPDEFSIYSFPPEIKKLAIDELDRLMEKHLEFLNEQTKNFVVATRQSLVQTIDDWSPESVKRFMKYVEKSDIEMYPISFKEEWPEVHAILERYMSA